MSEPRPASRRRPVPDHMFGGRLRGSYLLDLEVVGVDEVAPHVRLITMASSDLVGFGYTPGQDLLFEYPDGDRALPPSLHHPTVGSWGGNSRVRHRDPRWPRPCHPLGGQGRARRTPRAIGPEAGSACDQRRRPISSSSTTPLCQPPSSCSKRSPRARRPPPSS